MRYIGGKSLMLEHIRQVIEENISKAEGMTLFDCFSGSGVVSNYFKALGFPIISNDIMYFSYVLCRGSVGINEEPRFHGLEVGDPIEYLNGLTIEDTDFSPEDCFMYQNYSPHEKSERMYFQNKNAVKIDIVRLTIEKWHREGKLTEDEYFYLLCSLVSAIPYISNITGVYGAYLKHWDKRSYNDLTLERQPVVKGARPCPCFHENIDSLAGRVAADIAYLDTPYNQRQYLPNYHILETAAKYDYPEIQGVTGLRGYREEKSDFCLKNKVYDAFERVIGGLRARYLIVSYNNEGLMSTEQLSGLLQRYAKKGTFRLYEYDYNRYKNKIPNNTEGLKEQIYFIEKR